VNGDNILIYLRKVRWGVVYCSLLPVVYYSAFKMEALRYSETPVSVYLAVWRYNTNDSMLHSHQ
jgi:hypothetical protein